MTRKAKIIRFLSVFIVVEVLFNILTVTYTIGKIQLEKSQMEQIALNKSNKVSYVLTELLYKTEILSALVIQSNGEVKDFEKTAATILDNPAIRNVILAPNGVVEFVYPMTGNEKVIGFDYFSSSDGNAEAMQAKETGELVLGGPFELIQGGQALVGRLPIYIENNKFWGIVSVTLNYPLALDGADLDDLRNRGYMFEIWRISPDTGEKQCIASSDYAFNSLSTNYVEYPMDIMNAKWYFRLSPIREWYQFIESWVIIIVGLIISTLISYMVIYNQELKKMQKQLEQISFKDELTGIWNRRGLFHRLENCILKENRPFVLIYMDINKFKYVNDSYGHNVGDLLLKEFSKIVQKQLSERSYIFSRIGGDEFIIIITDEDNTNIAEIFDKNVNDELQKGLLLGKEKISASVSMGFAVFPKDGDNIDELIGVADKDMYLHKQKTKNN